MLRIYDCITTQHDLRFVAIAAIICLLASYTAVSLLGRATLAERRSRLFWQSGAAVVAGAGIWSTHFVAILAFQPGYPVGYDVALTLFSIAIAIGVSWIGFRIALYGGRYAATGGMVAGLGIACMHFVGMAALHLPAIPRWDTAYVATAVLIAVAFGALTLRTAVAAPISVERQSVATALYTLGIVGMHFTGMAAVTYVPDPGLAVSASEVDEKWLSVAVIAVTVLILGLGLIGAVVDQHLARRSEAEARLLRSHVAELEETRRELEATTANLTLALDAASASSQSKSQFLASMSHELRTPLNAVIGFSEIIAKELYGKLGNAQYLEYAQSIFDSGNHLLDVINDILDISKLDAGAMELEEDKVGPDQTVRDAMRMISRQAETARVAVEDALPPGLPRILCDGRRLKQVLLNLLSNAVKFTPAGGSVRITGHCDERGLTISVTDTGIGIAPEDIPRAFDCFGQIDGTLSRRYEGTGLGLPLSRGLMEMHGGALDLQSEVGVGTCVTITLPATRVVSDRQVA